MNANVRRLAAAQALAGANTTVVYASAALIGNTLAPHGWMATLPVSVFVAGMAAATLPAGALARRLGRRPVFLLGALCGVLLGLLGALAIAQSSFLLFCMAMPFGGAYAAVVLTFRFAAAESVPPPQRARALSLVMAGGAMAGVVGPQLLIHTRDTLPQHVFAATYLASAVVALLSALVLAGVALPPLTMATRERAAGSLLRALRRPGIALAVTCAAVSYMLMNFLMTSAPLAMRFCGLPADAASLGLQWHVIAMYAPGLLTGRLIARFGAPRVVVAGLLLTAAALAAGVSGLGVAHFQWLLALLGVGWNFGFTGASSMLLEAGQVGESAMQSRIQSVNDFIVFGSVTIASMLSGGLLQRYGWQQVCAMALGPVAIALAAHALGSSRYTAPRS
jgi:MFS family permease